MSEEIQQGEQIEREGPFVRDMRMECQGCGGHWVSPQNAQLLIEERDRLRKWKNEAMQVLGEWEEVWIAAGKPGTIGQPKALSVKEFIMERSRSNG